MIGLSILVWVTAQTAPLDDHGASPSAPAATRDEVESLIRALFDSDDPPKVALPGVEICGLAIGKDLDLTRGPSCIERSLKACKPAVLARAAIDWGTHEWLYYSVLWVKSNPSGCSLIYAFDSRPNLTGETRGLSVRKCSLPFEWGFHPPTDIGEILGCEQSQRLVECRPASRDPSCTKAGTNSPSADPNSPIKP